MENTISVFAVKSRIRCNSLLMGGHLAPGIKGAMIGALNKYCGGDVNRRYVLYWLFDYEEPPLKEKHTSALTGGQWSALYHWMDIGDQYEPCEQFKTEIAFVNKAALAVVGITQSDLDKIPTDDTIARQAIVLGGKVKDDGRTT